MTEPVRQEVFKSDLVSLLCYTYQGLESKVTFHPDNYVMALEQINILRSELENVKDSLIDLLEGNRISIAPSTTSFKLMKEDPKYSKYLEDD